MGRDCVETSACNSNNGTSVDDTNTTTPNQVWTERERGGGGEGVPTREIPGNRNRCIWLTGWLVYLEVADLIDIIFGLICLYLIFTWSLFDFHIVCLISHGHCSNN